jgi:hypothetical protein
VKEILALVSAFILIVSASAAEPTSKPFPYHGTLASVDPSKMTITLEGKKQPRVILVSPSTKYTRDGKTVKLTDGKKGDPVGGLMIKNAEGRQQAISVRYGLKAASEPEKAPSRPAPKQSPPK